MKIKTGDKVLVIAGKDRGKSGKVTRIISKHNRVVVEKVNMRTKHIKKTQQRAGDKIRYEAPFDASNVMILDPKENKPTRVGYKRDDKGKKERISKLTGMSLDNIVTETKKKAEKKTSEKKPKKKTIKA